MSYTIKHLGDGRFTAILDTGEVKEVGPNIIGMIRYTYFENLSYPPVDWQVSQHQLLQDYQPKVMKDIQAGKIKPGKHEFDQTDWIEIIK